MARKNLNVFEQHVEKIAVGAVAALFLWIIYGYLLGSPNKLELEGQMVGPSEIDQRVQAKAEQALSRIRGKQLDPTEVVDYPEEQQKLSQGPLHQEEFEVARVLVSSVSFGVPVPDVEGPQAAGQVTLATLLPPEKPALAVGRLTALFPPESVVIGDELDEDKQVLMQLEGPEDRSWVTLAVLYDYQKQREVLLKNNYQTNRFGLTISDVFLRRQMRQPNGEWGPWEEVKEYSQYHMDPEPELTLLADDVGRAYVPASQRNNLKIWFGNLREFQSDLVRPPMPDPHFGEPWRPPHLPDLIEMYPEEIFPEPKLVQADTKQKLSPLKQAKENLVHAKEFFADGKLGMAEALAETILSTRKAPKKVKQEARVLLEEIDEMIRQREIAVARRGGGDKQGGEDDEELDRRTEDIVFAHDLTAEPGASYRYQMKIQAFNQYATVVERMKDPLDALEIYIESEWSEPTAAVVIPSQQRVFLASAKEESAQFDIYQWVRGAWVKEKFNAKIGERIGGSKRVMIEGDRTSVEFDTQATLVELIPERPYIPRKRQRDGSFVLGEPEVSTAALCQWSSGEVFELVALAAKDDEERRQIEDSIKNARRSKRKPPKRDMGLGRPAGRGRGGG